MATGESDDYLIRLLTFLLGRQPSDTEVRLWRSERSSDIVKRDGPWGGWANAKSKRHRRNRLSLGLGLRQQQSTNDEKQAWLKAHDAVARALDLERLLGSFNHAGRDNFPVEFIDEVADNLLVWIDEAGFRVVPKTTDSSSPPLPELPLYGPDLDMMDADTFLISADSQDPQNGGHVVEEEVEEEEEYEDEDDEDIEEDEEEFYVDEEGFYVIPCPFCGVSDMYPCEHLLGRWDDSSMEWSCGRYQDPPSIRPFLSLLDALNVLDESDESWEAFKEELDRSSLKAEVEYLLRAALSHDYASSLFYLEYFRYLDGVIVRVGNWDSSPGASGIWYSLFHPDPPTLYAKLDALGAEALALFRSAQRLQEHEGY